jgi:hypothetical protein
MKTTSLSAFESDLVEWFNIVSAKKITISGPLITEKALQLAEKHNLKDFSGSTVLRKGTTSLHAVSTSCSSM